MNIYQNFISNNSQLLHENNIQDLKRLKIGSKNNVLGLPETMSNYDYLKHISTLPYLSKDQKSTINDIISIDKKNRYIKWANKYVPKPENLTKSQLERIILVVQESFHIAKIMKNAFPFNIKSDVENEFHQNNLVLSGGAIRDILFCPESSIKDLDFCFAFISDCVNTQKFTHIHPTTIFQFMESGEISREHQEDPLYLEKLHQVNVDTSYIRDSKKRQTLLENFEFAFFVRFHIAKHGAASDVIFAGLTEDVLYNEMGWEEYINFNLAATIKTTGKSGIPIDILVAAGNNNKLIKSFDFCICKSSLNLNNILDVFSETPSADECLTFFYNNLDVPITVLRDLNSKELSISSEYTENPEKIDFFINKHYKRLLVKYPGFQFNIENSIGNFNNLEKLNELRKKYKINEIFQSSNDTSKQDNDDFKI